MAAKRPADSDERENAGKKQAREQKPFTDVDEPSDLVLTVEDTKLYVHKSVLGFYSPVFKKMFVGNFKEKNAQVIPMQGKKLDSFVPFLKQMYPVHSLTPVTDETIADMLALADEYDVKHIRRKCEHFIESQLTSRGESLSTDQNLLYLWMSESYKWEEPRERLVDMAAKRYIDDLEESQYFQPLSLQATKDVMLKRCKNLEMANADLSKQNTNLQRSNTIVEANYKKQRTAVTDLQHSARAFFETLDIRNNCAKGDQKDAFECQKPYNTERYCKFCWKTKMKNAILYPLQRL